MKKVKTVSFLMLGWRLGTEAVSVGNGMSYGSLNTNASITPTASSESIPCSFNIENFKYDLCPLLQSHTRHMKLTISEDTPPTLTRKTYEISLEGALKRDGTLPAELQCPGGTWICLTVVNTRPNHPSEPSRILQVVPVAGSSSITRIEQKTDELVPKFKLVRTNNESDGDPGSDPSLRMTLHGGTYTGQKQKAAFLFECDRSRERAEKTGGIASTPKFVWSFNGTHTFEWKSVYACPDTLVSQPPKSGNGNDHEQDDEDVDPPADPDLDVEEPVHGTFPPLKEDSRAIIGPYSVLWFPSLLLILYLASKKLLPASTRRLWSSVRWKLWGLSGYRYRSLEGDSVLSDDEEGPREYEVNAEIFNYGEFEGEEIPLTPSPRKETFGYGVLK
ncbi:hypothetical protein L218DRAFT_966382 [Marasmius fiardii PR-910]|nr:hypothetical protein L218DRAFT_966382 [Marasmius fiardii PR-910]